MEQLRRTVYTLLNSAYPKSEYDESYHLAWMATRPFGLKEKNPPRILFQLGNGKFAKSVHGRGVNRRLMHIFNDADEAFRWLFKRG